MQIPSFVKFLSAGLAIWLSGLTAEPAHAYYPCNGPGPGEVLIGVDNTNGVQTPLCEYVGEDDGYTGGASGPSGYWAERFAAVAWGQDAGGNATYSWYVNASSFGEAETGAVNACVSSGSRNCKVGPSVANGSLAVASGSNGILYADFGEDNGQAKRKALRLCKKSSKGCRIEKLLESPSVWISD